MLPDCKHELRPVKCGFRLALVYNVLNISASPSPEVTECSYVKHLITVIFSEWASDKDVPDVGIYVLDHRYVPYF